MSELLEKAERLLECDRLVSELDAQLKAAKEERDEANIELVELMLDSELQSLNFKGKLLYLTTRPSVSYDKEQEEAFFNALRTNGYADIIRPAVNSRTLTATVTKELMAEDGNGNRALPDWIKGYLKIYEETKVSMRKGS